MRRLKLPRRGVKCGAIRLSRDMSFASGRKIGIIMASVSLRVPLIEVLMIPNQGYWLLMVKIELSNRLKLIKYQMKIFQVLR